MVPVRRSLDKTFPLKIRKGLDAALNRNWIWKFDLPSISNDDIAEKSHNEFLSILTLKKTEKQFLNQFRDSGMAFHFWSMF